MPTAAQPQMRLTRRAFIGGATIAPALRLGAASAFVGLECDIAAVLAMYHSPCDKRGDYFGRFYPASEGNDELLL